MFESKNNSDTNASNFDPDRSVNPGITERISEESLRTFGEWLDAELEILETSYPEFETKNSFRGFIGRG